MSVVTQTCSNLPMSHCCSKGHLSFRIFAEWECAKQLSTIEFGEPRICTDLSAASKLGNTHYSMYHTQVQSSYVYNLKIYYQKVVQTPTFPEAVFIKANSLPAPSSAASSSNPVPGDVMANTLKQCTVNSGD